MIHSTLHKHTHTHTHTTEPPPFHSNENLHAARDDNVGHPPHILLVNHFTDVRLDRRRDLRKGGRAEEGEHQELARDVHSRSYALPPYEVLVPVFAEGEKRG